METNEHVDAPFTPGYGSFPVRLTADSPEFRIDIGDAFEEQQRIHKMQKAAIDAGEPIPDWLDFFQEYIGKQGGPAMRRFELESIWLEVERRYAGEKKERVENTRAMWKSLTTTD
jgi:hypothetical protein